MNTSLSGSVALRQDDERAAGPRLEIAPSREERAHEVLSATALDLLLQLHARFEPRRRALLAARAERQDAFDAGEWPRLLPASADVRNASWRIAPVPGDLQDRCVEIVGPPERAFLAQALSAPVQTCLADFEDGCSPTWSNVLRGQINLADAVRGRLASAERIAGSLRGNRPVAIMVRPRGWHLTEKHVRVGGLAVSAALFDFALYLAGNHELLVRRGSAPYLYLPKLEGHEEARLWNDVFVFAQERLGLPRGTIRATVLIETVPAAFEMDEILFELREHVLGLSTGRWDYVFSGIKKFRHRSDWILPDRSALGMDGPPLRAYEQLLIQTCRRRGAQAIGGMAAQMTIHSEPAANAMAMAAVRADKLREARAGLDGSWIGYPILAPIARRAFEEVHAEAHRARGTSAEREIPVDPAEMLRVPDGVVTEAGVRLNIRIGVQYLEAWLRGIGTVPLYHQLEDAATAEICRAQLWQWVHHETRTAQGWALTPERFHMLLTEELEAIHREVGSQRTLGGVFPSATRLFDALVTDEHFEEFMTLPAYELLS